MNVGHVGEGAGPRWELLPHASKYAGQSPKRDWGAHVLSERFRVEIRDTVRTGFRLYRSSGGPPEGPRVQPDSGRYNHSFSQGIRLLLWGGAGGGIRLSGQKEIPGSYHLPGGRDHP